MQIRLAENKDLDQIVELIKTSILGEVYFLDKDLSGIVRPSISKQLVYVMEDQDLLAFLWLSQNGCFEKYPYLHMLVVKEGLRSKGYGRQMIDYFENVICRDRQKVFLMVGDYNLRARRLYEKLGYKEVGCLPDFYKDQVTEYLMMKTI